MRINREGVPDVGVLAAIQTKAKPPKGGDAKSPV
jgi:hypothetical protein